MGAVVDFFGSVSDFIEYLLRHIFFELHTILPPRYNILLTSFFVLFPALLLFTLVFYCNAYSDAKRIRANLQTVQSLRESHPKRADFLREMAALKKQNRSPFKLIVFIGSLLLIFFFFAYFVALDNVFSFRSFSSFEAIFYLLASNVLFAIASKIDPVQRLVARYETKADKRSKMKIHLLLDVLLAVQIFLIPSLGGLSGVSVLSSLNVFIYVYFLGTLAQLLISGVAAVFFPID